MRAFWHIFIFWMTWGVVAAHAADEWSQYTGTPEANWTQIQREWMPQSKSRAATYVAARAAQNEFFAGRATLDRAFPEYSAVDLSDPVVIEGLLVRLDDAVGARFYLKKEHVPDLGDVRRVDKVWNQRRVERDALEEADAGRRRFLLGVRAHLRAHPDLVRAAVSRVEEDFQVIKDAARELDEGAPEATREGAMRRAARAEEALALNADVLHRLRVHAVTGQALVLDIEAELKRLDNAETMLGARVRLSWVKPFLTAGESQRVDAVLFSAEQAYTLSRLGSEITKVERRINAAADGVVPEGDAAFWTEQLATLGLQRNTHLDAAEQEGAVWDAQKRLLDLRIEEATRSLQLLSKDENVTTRTSEAQDKVADAQREAETAREAANDAQEERTALLLEYRQKAQERATAVWERIQETESAGDVRQNELNEQLDNFENQLDALSRPGLLRSAGVNADEIYREIRTEIERLRLESGQLGDALVAAQAVRTDKELGIREELARANAEGDEAAQLTDVALKASRIDAIGSWISALEGELEAVTVQVDVARKLREQRLRSLYGAQNIRKGLARYISAAEHRVDRGNLLREAFAECLLAGPGLQSFFRSRWHAFIAMPSRLLDVNFMSRLLGSALGLCVVLLIWGSGRRYGQTGAQRLVGRLVPGESAVLDSDRSSLEDSVERLIVAIVDLFASTMLYWFAPTDLPELTFFLLVVFEVALFRALLAIYDLASSVEPSNRPSLVRLGASAAPVARNTVSWVLVWWVGRRVGLTVSGDLLNGYALEALVSAVFSLWFVVIAVVLLHRWNPIVRARIEQQSRKTVLVRWFSQVPRTRLVFFLQSMAGIVFLCVVVLWDLTFRLGGTDGVIGRVLNRVSRLQLNRATENEVSIEHSLPRHLMDGLYAPERADETMDQRGDCLALIVDAIREWDTEGKRGLISVLADSGGGKRSTIDLLSSMWDDETIPLVRMTMTTRVTHRTSMYHWLANAFSLPKVPQTVQEAVALVSEHVPDGVFVLEQAHSGYLKTVGGFDGFRELIYVLNATSEKRCWILVMHRPAWNYLSRLGELINLSVFRTVCVLPGFSEEALRALCVGRVKALGYRLDFTDIVRRNVLGSDPAVELDRAISVFFRLLKESSLGNPEIALSLWAKSLTATEDRVLRVRMGEDLNVRPMADLSETELFTLVALRTQERLSEEEIVAVTNMSRTKVRGTVKHLIGTGVLHRQGDQYRVAVRHIPAVDLTLRRRRYMQGGEA